MLTLADPVKELLGVEDADPVAPVLVVPTALAVTDTDGLFDTEDEPLADLLPLPDLLADADTDEQAEAEGVLERDKDAEEDAVLEGDFVEEPLLLEEPEADAERVAVSVCELVGPAEPVEEAVGVLVGLAEFVGRGVFEEVRLDTLEKVT